MEKVMLVHYSVSDGNYRIHSHRIKTESETFVSEYVSPTSREENHKFLKNNSAVIFQITAHLNEL